MFYGFFGATMNMLCIHFIYRYAAVSGISLLETFQSWKLLVWFSFPLINGAVWVAAACYLFRSTDFFNDFLVEHYSAERDLEVSDFSYFGAMFYPKTANGTEYLHWDSIDGCLLILALIKISIVTIIFFGIRCFLVMRSFVANSSESARLKRLQEQLFYALVLQTLIPMILLHIPSSLLVFTLIFDVSEEWAGKLLSTSTAFYPAINPIPTIFIIDSYRKALQNYFMILKNVILCRIVTETPTEAQLSQMTVTQVSCVNRSEI